MKRPNTDKIHALLSPHEAVLNRRAADLLGRDKIKKLNAKGNALERRKYEGGTSDVGNERGDLLRDVDATFYGGGHAPVPTPTPTPKPRKYLYGTSDVSPYNQNQNAMSYTAPAAGGGAPSGSTTGSTTGNINVTSSSFGVSPFSAPVPDMRYADPATLNRLNIDDLIYDPNATGGGGYRFSQYIHSPGTQVLSPRYIGDFQGQDANANRRASQFYNYIGGLPTLPIGTQALNQLYGMTGQQPAQGPSYNSILSNYFNNASPYMQSQFKQAGFGRTYTGPYAFGNG